MLWNMCSFPELVSSAWTVLPFIVKYDLCGRRERRSPVKRPYFTRDKKNMLHGQMCVFRKLIREYNHKMVQWSIAWSTTSYEKRNAMDEHLQHLFGRSLATNKVFRH